MRYGRNLVCPKGGLTARRDDEKKTHPCLVPYEELPEIEKDYDRNTAIGTLKLIQALGFDIVKKR